MFLLILPMFLLILPIISSFSCANTKFLHFHEEALCLSINSVKKTVLSFTIFAFLPSIEKESCLNTLK